MQYLSQLMVVLTSVTSLDIMCTSYSKCTLILNLGTSWRRMVNFTPRQLYPRYLFNGDWMEKRKFMVLEVEWNLGSSSPLYGHFTDPVLCSRLCASCLSEAVLSESFYSPGNAVYFWWLNHYWSPERKQNIHQKSGEKESCDPTAFAL